MFTRLLISIANASSNTKCFWLSSKKCTIQPTHVNLNPNEHSYKFHSYSLLVKLDRCAESYNTLNDLSNKLCAPNKAEDINIGVFNMNAEINEPKTLTKHISCKCQFKFDGKNVIRINGEIMINVDVIVKNVVYVIKITFGMLLHAVVKMEML